jgi:hypothetical protein
MMSKSIIQSERQRPRSIELMKDIYASHVADPKCGLGANCPMMLDLKKKIEAEEALLEPGSNFSRSSGLK